MSQLGQRADVYAVLTDRSIGVASGASTTVGATVVQSTKGFPFTVTRVSRDNFPRLLGKPMRGDNSCYHLDAFLARGQMANVVRVVNQTDWMFPSIAQDTATGNAVTSAHTYGTTVAPLAGTTHVIFWVKTGEVGDNYAVEITNIDATEETMDVKVIERNAAGVERVVETLTCSPNPDKRNADGEYLYLPNRMAVSQYVDCAIATGASITDFGTGLARTYFTGGAVGSAPVTADYTAAIDKLRAEGIEANLIFTGSEDTSVITAMTQLAEEKYGHCFVDIPTSVTSAANAVTWASTTLGLTSARLSIYVGNMTVNDRFYGGRVSVGAAGGAAGACAYGDAIMGLHASPAGESRAKLDSFTGIALDMPLTVTDLELLAENRLNPVVAASSGGVMINDAFTRFGQRSVQEQIHVTRIAGYVVRSLKRALMSDLHSAQGDQLMRILNNKAEAILSPLQAVGALVPTKDGQPPYTVEIYPDDIEDDLYRVRTFISCSRVARRIELEVILLR